MKDFRIMVESACSTLGRCWFITLTLRKVDYERPKDAEYVKAIWRRCLHQYRRWYPKEFKRMAWVKVIELTKKSQPHIHLIVGGLQAKGTIEEQKREIKKRWKRCWTSATKGFSYIVHVTEVHGAAGAAGYIGGYVEKDWLHWDEMLARGFKRHWQASNNWPRGKIQMNGTREKRWFKFGKEEKTSHFTYGSSASAEELLQEAENRGIVPETGDGDHVVQLGGDPVTLEVVERRIKRAKLYKIKKLQEALNVNKGFSTDV